MKENLYAEILNFVIDNGRVQANGHGGLVKASVAAEVEFEATERGLSDDEIKAAVAWAKKHTK